MCQNKYTLTFIFWISFITCYAQTSSKQDLKLIINQIAVAHNVQFNYKSGILDNYTILAPEEGLPLSQKIVFLEKYTPFIFEKISSNIFTINAPQQLCGYLKDAINKTPLQGVTIQYKGVNKNANVGTITNSLGYFEFQLSINDTLTINHLGYKSYKLPSTFFTTTPCNTFFMQPVRDTLSPVLLNSYIVKGMRKSMDGNIQFDFSKFSQLPGLIETDVLQAVQALPGVQSIDETVSNISVRGGSHDQNLILWDGIKMYQSSHFFGLISSFNPHTSQEAILTNNGTSPEFSDGVSSTILLNTKSKIPEKSEGHFTINFLNASGFLDIPFNKKSSLQIAARRSLNDLVQTPTYTRYFQRITQQTELEDTATQEVNNNEAFRFYDTALRWLYKPTSKDQLRVNFLLINNLLSFDETLTIENTTTSRKSSISQNSIAAGIFYERQWHSNLKTEISLYETDYKLQAINANIIENQRFLQENKVSETSIKLKNTYNKKRLNLITGYQFVESEITNLNDIDVPRFVRLNSRVIREHALFLQATYKDPSNIITLKPGLRYNYITKFKTSLLEPRLVINTQVTPRLQLLLKGEFKHQNSSQIINFQNDFLGIEKRRWQFTDNDSIPILRSQQASIGFLYNNKAWLIDLNTYIKQINGITTQSQGFTTKYEFEKEKGQFNAVGIDFLIRYKKPRYSAWLSYSHLVSEYTFETLEPFPFPTNFDTTHAFTFGATYNSSFLNLATGLNYRTGIPTSIPLENQPDNNTIVFASTNTARLTNFLRLDASAYIKQNLSENIKSEIGASVWNVTNQQNELNNFYRRQDSTIKKNTLFSLGTTANVFIKILF